MERAFRKAPYPDVNVRETLAKQLDLNESRIQVTFVYKIIVMVEKVLLFRNTMAQVVTRRAKYSVGLCV